MFDLVGQRFAQLTVLEKAPRRKEHHGQTAWSCLCDCGKTAIVTSRELRSGHTRSCGCFKQMRSKEVNLKHGQASNGKMGLQYRAWIEMKQRCYNPNQIGYANYGGRGIKVCDRWNESYEAFVADMGDRPKKHSLERKNNDGDYEPSNCIWATRKQQMRNKRSNRTITIDGETKCVSEWAELRGLNYHTVICRLNRGWPPEKSLGMQYA